MLDVFFSEGKIREFVEKLDSNSGKGIGEFLKESVFFSCCLALAAAIAAFFFGLQFLPAVLLCTGAFIASMLLLFFWEEYVFEKNKRAKEMLVPDALLQAAMFPEKTDVVKIISYLEKAGYGLLGKEFGQARAEIEKGKSVKEALEEMKKRNKSKVIDRMANLLIQGYESGADMQSVFRETADDLLETNAIIRERAATMAIEKYTLLFAGGIIVPVVLGLIVGMAQKFSFVGFGEMEIGMPVAERKALLEAALLGNVVYIAEYALIASCFLAFQEGNRKKAVVYAILLLPAGLLAYAAAKGI